MPDIQRPESPIQRSISPLPIIPSLGDGALSSKSKFLVPPPQTYGAQKAPRHPSLRLDTSEDGLRVSPPITVTPGIPTSQPLEFRDSGELPRPVGRKLYRWWPYSVLPDPQVLYINFFPTIHDFHLKTWSQKILAVIAVPAVFFLTITLPVVDSETVEANGDIKLPSRTTSPTTLVETLPDGRSDVIRPVSPEEIDIIVPRGWSQWLTGVQCIFAPLFVTFIIFRMLIAHWANSRG